MNTKARLVCLIGFVVLLCAWVFDDSAESKHLVSHSATQLPSSAHTQSNASNSSVYYILAQGCVEMPGQGAACENQPEIDWGLYLDFFREHYGFASDEQGKTEFKGWANSHIQYVQSPDFDPGRIAMAVDAIHPENGRVFMIRHSAGGAAIMNYLTTLSHRSDALIPPIACAVATHAPLGDMREAPISTSLAWLIALPTLSSAAYPTLNLAGLGAWAKQKNIALQIISYQDDVVNPHRQVADIPFYQYPSDSAYDVKPYEFARKHGYLMSYSIGVRKMLMRLFEQGLIK